MNHLNCMKCQWVCIIAVCGWYIRFNGMCHCIHTCMGYQLYRHCFSQFRVYDCNIRCDFKISQRILNTFFVICDNWECRNFRCCTGCRRYCTEMCFFTKLRHTEYLAHFFKCNVRIFIFYPHCLCCINRRTAANRYNPVRSVFFHNLSTLHDSVYWRVGFDALKQFYFHSCFF